MRINKWIARQTGIGRRTADDLIERGEVLINGVVATLGQEVDGSEEIIVEGRAVATSTDHTTLLFHKPRGYVCSRNGQGSQTVYDLLPTEYQDLKIAGRLDRDSSGLLVLSNDGDVIQQLTHPTRHKQKTYILTTRHPLTDQDIMLINTIGVDIGDERPSRFTITPMGEDRTYKAVLLEGRNRQIRRTLEAVGNQVATLHRTNIGSYSLGDLAEGDWKSA
jgi:pseudouridine synthase